MTDRTERMTRDIATDVARARLRRYEEERELRLAIYRLHWSQAWAAPPKPIPMPRSSDRLWRVK